MANWFIDTELTTGGDSGTTMDDAYQSWIGLQGIGFAAGDIIWVRRRSVEVLTEIIDVTDDGTGAEAIECIGWPRAAATGTGSIVQGERVMYGMGTIVPGFGKHVTRNIQVDADGNDYMISAIIRKIDYASETGTFTEGLEVTGTASLAKGKIHKLVDNGTTGTLYVVMITSTNFSAAEEITDTDTGVAAVNGTPADDGFALEMRYAGTTVVGGAVTIEEDEDYTLAQAIDDSTWTIKKTDYNSDADALPKFDATGTVFYLYQSAGHWWKYKNLHFIGGNIIYSPLYIRSTQAVKFFHVIVESTANYIAVRLYDTSTRYIFEYFVIRGTAAGASQSGITFTSGRMQFRHFAIYNLGDRGFYFIGLEAVVIESGTMGVMTHNGDYNIVDQTGVFSGRDVEFDYASLNILYPYQTPALTGAQMMSYDQTLNNELVGGLSTRESFSIPVVAGSGDPEKRTDGADVVVSVLPVSNVVYTILPFDDRVGWVTFKPQYVLADTTSSSYRYYIQSKIVLTAGEIILFCEYVSQYDSGTGAYYRKIAKSDEAIAVRTGVNDWSQYIEVIGIQPAVASQVKLWILYGVAGGSTDNIYIDPLPEIT